MEGLDEMLRTLLADPQSLAGALDAVRGLCPQTAQPKPPAGGRTEVLLQTLRPLLPPRMQPKLDRALEAARLARLAAPALWRSGPDGTEEGTP